MLCGPDVRAVSWSNLPAPDGLGFPALAALIVHSRPGRDNNHPAVYSDPDRLDVTRIGIRASSFGGGIHTRLGARLARLEGEIAFQTLLRRLPDLKLENIDNPDWRQTFTLRGMTALKARW